MLKLDIEYVKKLMSEKNISAYWMEQETRNNAEDYPVLLIQSTLSKVFNGHKNITINQAKSLSLILKVKWKDLILD